MKTNLFIFFCLFLAKTTFTQTPQVQDSTTMCTMEFSYKDTAYADSGEEWHLKRTYFTKNIFIDSTAYSDINLTGVL